MLLFDGFIRSGLVRSSHVVLVFDFILTHRVNADEVVFHLQYLLNDVLESYNSQMSPGLLGGHHSDMRLTRDFTSCPGHTRMGCLLTLPSLKKLSSVRSGVRSSTMMFRL